MLYLDMLNLKKIKAEAQVQLKGMLVFIAIILLIIIISELIIRF